MNIHIKSSEVAALENLMKSLDSEIFYMENLGSYLREKQTDVFTNSDFKDFLFQKFEIQVIKPNNIKLDMDIKDISKENKTILNKMGKYITYTSLSGVFEKLVDLSNPTEEKKRIRSSGIKINLAKVSKSPYAKYFSEIVVLEPNKITNQTTPRKKQKKNTNNTTTANPETYPNQITETLVTSQIPPGYEFLQQLSLEEIARLIKEKDCVIKTLTEQNQSLTTEVKELKNQIANAEADRYLTFPPDDKDTPNVNQQDSAARRNHAFFKDTRYVAWDPVILPTTPEKKDNPIQTPSPTIIQQQEEKDIIKPAHTIQNEKECVTFLVKVTGLCRKDIVKKLEFTKNEHTFGVRLNQTGIYKNKPYTQEFKNEIYNFCKEYYEKNISQLDASMQDKVRNNLEFLKAWKDIETTTYDSDDINTDEEQTPIREIRLN